MITGMFNSKCRILIEANPKDWPCNLYWICCNNCEDLLLCIPVTTCTPPPALSRSRVSSSPSTRSPPCWGRSTGDRSLPGKCPQTGHPGPGREGTITEAACWSVEWYWTISLSHLWEDCSFSIWDSLFTHPCVPLLVVSLLGGTKLTSVNSNKTRSRSG